MSSIQVIPMARHEKSGADVLGVDYSARSAAMIALSRTEKIDPNDVYVMPETNNLYFLFLSPDSSFFAPMKLASLERVGWAYQIFQEFRRGQQDLYEACLVSASMFEENKMSEFRSSLMRARECNMLLCLKWLIERAAEIGKSEDEVRQLFCG